MDNIILNIQLELKSEKKAVRHIETLAKQIRKKVELSEDIYYNMLIALTEAVNNAIIHGNKLDKSRKVYVSALINDKEIELDIHDEGAGFNPDEVADPREPENLLKESGRGIFIIGELADSYQYTFSDKGTKLKIIFKIDKKDTR